MSGRRPRHTLATHRSGCRSSWRRQSESRKAGRKYYLMFPGMCGGDEDPGGGGDTCQVPPPKTAGELFAAAGKKGKNGMRRRVTREFAWFLRVRRFAGTRKQVRKPKCQEAYYAMLGGRTKRRRNLFLVSHIGLFDPFLVTSEQLRDITRSS